MKNGETRKLNIPDWPNREGDVVAFWHLTEYMSLQCGIAWDGLAGLLLWPHLMNVL